MERENVTKPLKSGKKTNKTNETKPEKGMQDDRPLAKDKAKEGVMSAPAAAQTDTVKNQQTQSPHFSHADVHMTQNKDNATPPLHRPINESTMLDDDQDTFVEHALKKNMTFKKMLKWVGLFFWHAFDRYIHSEHKNLRLFTRMTLTTAFSITLLALFPQTFEGLIAPSTKEIAKLQATVSKLDTQLKAVTQSQQKLTHSLDSTSSQNGQAIKAIAQDLNALKNKIGLLASSGSAAVEKTPTNLPFTGSLPEAIETIKEAIIKGQAFEGPLEHVKKMTSDNPTVQPLLSTLSKFANAPAKGNETLSKDLVLIKGRLMFGGSPENVGIWQKIINTITQMLTLKPSSQNSVKIDNKADQEYVVSILEQAIGMINSHQLKDAITTIRQAKPIVAEAVSNWLADADRALEAQETLAHFMQTMGAHTTMNGA